MNEYSPVPRFKRKYIIAPEAGCWLWTASKGIKGYGSFYFEERVQAAHRVSWKIHNGAIPEGMFVCHKCDNPSCVNPQHLFLGTAKDNNEDASIKGRSSRLNGESNGRSKLKVEDVLSIRAIIDKTEEEIAAVYKVSRQTINNIKLRKKWRHV